MLHNNTVIPHQTKDQLTQTPEQALPETTSQELENSEKTWLEVYGIYLAIGALVIAAALGVAILKKKVKFNRLSAQL